jgi:hypothetical protein
MGKKLKTRTVIVALILAIVSEGMILTADSRAFDRRNTRARGPVIYRPGTVVAKLPAGHQAVRVRKKNYFYHGGTFFQQRPKGFVTVRPPMGAVVRDLPLGFTTAVIAGATYFFLAEACYRPVPAGYMVVTPPVIKASTPVNSSISVTAELLNVRAGPGTEHPVIAKVSRGTVLTVRGQAPDWLYIELPGGDFGWVMDRFTYCLPPPAEG